MSLPRALLLSLVFLCPLTLSAQVANTQDSHPLTNSDVLLMVTARFDDATIIKAIQAQDTDFNVSTGALVSLKNDGVDQAVIQAMLSASAEKKTPKAQTTQTVRERSVDDPKSFKQQNASLALGKDFRKAALRSSDAILKLHGDAVLAAVSHYMPDVTNEKAEGEYLISERDASKTLTEAKIEAESPDEKQFYQLLEDYEGVADSVRYINPMSEKVKEERYFAVFLQCSFEVESVIDPDEITKEMTAAAKLSPSCLDGYARLKKDFENYSQFH